MTGLASRLRWLLKPRTWRLIWHELFNPERCHCGHFANYNYGENAEILWCTDCKYGCGGPCPCSSPPYRLPDPLPAPRWFHVWFYRPEWYWHGLSTLLPVHCGGDEWDRWTLMFGWPITGRVVVALW